MPAGDRKIPDPMVIPMTIVTALHRPRLLGSPSLRPSLPAGVADMRLMVQQETARREPCLMMSANVGDGSAQCRDPCRAKVESKGTGVHLSVLLTPTSRGPIDAAAVHWLA
jgi:hypothetical protein